MGFLVQSFLLSAKIMLPFIYNLSSVNAHRLGIIPQGRGIIPQRNGNIAGRHFNKILLLASDMFFSFWNITCKIILKMMKRGGDLRNTTIEGNHMVNRTKKSI
jgi:hypothetical protein